MQNARWQRLALLGLTSLAGVLAGCNQQGGPDNAQSTVAQAQVPTMDWEMQWAQAALERNPNVKLLAADREQRAFTVRDLRTTMTAEVQLAQIAAAPLEFLTQPSSPPSSTPAEPAPKPAVSTPTEPEVVTRLADAVTEAPTTVAPKPSPTYTIERSGGRTRVTGDGISVVYGETPNIRVANSLSNEPNQQHTPDRTKRAVRIDLPGASIVPSDSLDAATLLNDPQAEIEPVICEGPRVMQLDSRTLNVDGDALTARGGCELYITNSTIIASGTGVVIGDAIVHINNSRVEGGLASFEAKEQAKVFLRGSTLNGLPRRARQALIQDQGGNSYQ